MKWASRDQETVERRKARVLHEIAYNHIVHRPAELMRKTSAPDEEISAFRKAANAVVNLFALSIRAYNFETASPRAPELRASERK